MNLRPAIAVRLRDAAVRLDQRQPGAARDLLIDVVRAAPECVEARHLLGVTWRLLGDVAAAERELRAALAIDPSFDAAVLELARLLAALGRHREVIALTAASIGEPLLIVRARAFQALGDIKACVAVRERLVALDPAKPKPQHNLAAALGDAGYAERSEAAARAALAAGGDAPETWLVLARALQSQHRFDAAAQAFHETLRRRPGFIDALRDLAQLVWMQTGDLSAAVAVLDRAAVPAADQARLRVIAARLHDDAGDPRGGYDRLMREGVAGDALLEVTAAHLVMRLDPALALGHAQRASALAPGADTVERKLIEIQLANGQATAALGRIAARLALQPLDQGLIALQWTAWRLLADPRAAQLYDYDAFVLAQTIECPPGWALLEDFLADLAATLRRLHTLHTHPLDQSLRHGTQTSVNLLRSEDPVIRALIAGLDPPIRRYLALIGAGQDRVRIRNTLEYRFTGMWSVNLRPHGYHVNHVHPAGWLSSAFYIEVPHPAGQATPGEGWLEFGAPGFPTAPEVAAEHAIEPLPGRLVMFPSYMWHGTVPFSAGSRLLLAFDIVPG